MGKFKISLKNQKQFVNVPFFCLIEGRRITD